VFLDIPIARQIVGFAFLTFVPGLCAIQVLGLKQASKLELFLFSIGISVAFSMISGFMLNEFGSLGLVMPLSTIPILICLVGFTTCCGAIGYIGKRESQPFTFRLRKTEVLRLLPFGFVVLSIVGAFFVNVYNNNLLLLFLLMGLSVLFAVLFVFERAETSGFYAVVVFVIALSLLFHSSLISNYIVSFGSDVPVEYSVFKFTQQNYLWSANPTGNPYYSRISSMLSVTILPTFYSSILNIDATILFKILYPVILAFVPLCLFAIWQQFFARKYAFAASFLLIAQQAFFTEMLGVGRQIVAELFFALLLLVIFHKGIKPISKNILFVIFSFGLVVSHYALSEIFLGFIVVALALSFISKTINRRLTVFYVVSFAVIMFSWYVFTPGSAVINAITADTNYVLSQIGGFFDPASRGQTVLLGLGFGGFPTIWNTLSRMFAYATEFLIVIGATALLSRKIKLSIDRDYLTFTFIGLAFLFAVIAVPGLANTLNITRFYHILLFVLAPLCILGIDFIANFVHKHKRAFVSLFVVVILVPYFMFQTSFVYEIAKTDSWSISINKNSMPPSRLHSQIGYTDASSAFGVEWISKNINALKTSLYADTSALAYLVMSSAGRNRYTIKDLTNDTTILPGGTVYLSSFNTNEKIIIGASSWNIDELSFQTNDLNKLYDNGQAQICQNQP
jgi:uncharacterized membrane protein